MNGPKPYIIAKICYDPENKDFPWYVARYGTVAEQGGFNFGVEYSSYEKIKDACTDLSQLISKDIEIIKGKIKEKECWNVENS